MLTQKYVGYYKYCLSIIQFGPAILNIHWVTERLQKSWKESKYIIKEVMDFFDMYDLSKFLIFREMYSNQLNSVECI